MIASARTSVALVAMLISLLIMAQARPVSAQEETAGSAQYPEEGGPSPTQYEGAPAPAEAPPSAQPAQYGPEDAAGDECDPAYEECEAPATEDFVGEAAGDAQQTEGTLDGSAGAPAPAEEPAYVPGEPPDAPPPYGSGQYPAYGSAVPQEEIAPFPSPPPPEPVAPVAARTAPVEEFGYVAEPAPEDAASTPAPDAPRADASRADEGEGEPAEKAGPGRARPEGGREPTTARDSRPAGRTIEERERAVQDPAAGSGGAGTLYTLGGSAFLIAGAALVGRFLKR